MAVPVHIRNPDERRGIGSGDVKRRAERAVTLAEHHHDALYGLLVHARRVNRGGGAVRSQQVGNSVVINVRGHGGVRRPAYRNGTVRNESAFCRSSQGGNGKEEEWR